MNDELRRELRKYYQNSHEEIAQSCKRRCWDALDDKLKNTGLSVCAQKGLQYDCIPDFCAPRLFRNTWFFSETGTIPMSDMNRSCGTWTYMRNGRVYDENVDAAIAAERNHCMTVPVYFICGRYADELNHFAFDMTGILNGGVKPLYEAAVSAAETEESEKAEFFTAMAKGLYAIKRMGEQFADLAEAELADTRDARRIEQLRWIADAARRIPWEAPRTFREALNTVALLQNVFPSLEGGSLESMGRMDVMLEPFYKRDIEAGIATEEELYRDICDFLLLWDSRCAEDWKQEDNEVIDPGYTYTLGGCDENGNAVYNKVTELFLKANSETEVIYPKIKCRFRKDMPEEYFRLINADIAKGRTTTIYQNDDAFIPALVRAGFSEKDARDYRLLGCWEPVVPGMIDNHCGYVNLLKILELSVFGDFKSPDVAWDLESLCGAETFAEVYRRVINNIRLVMESKRRVAMHAKPFWHRVDPHPVYSSVVSECMERGKDITGDGARYRIDDIVCAGFANVADSLLAIQSLCFDKKKLSLKEYLAAVRRNWDGAEDLRRQALHAPFYGDGGEESAAMARRLHGDIARIVNNLPKADGEIVNLGYMLYTEMGRWAKTLRATPDGRRLGDAFARGLTPSYLHHLSAVSEVFDALKDVDTTDCAANSVVNITVPFREQPLALWDGLLRAAACSHAQAIQINCVSKEELLKAQKHPEKYGHLVVRVCGFSAKFVSLSRNTQDEFLERNFYEKLENSSK